MAPLPDGVPRFGASFQHDQVEAAFKSVCSSCEADRSGTNDGNCFWGRVRYQSILPEGSNIKANKLSGIRLCDHWLACAFSATFRNQKPDKRAHHIVIRAADEGCRLPFLRDQPDDEHRLQVVRKGRCGDFELGLQLANAEAAVSRLHKGAIDLETCRISKGF